MAYLKNTVFFGALAAGLVVWYLWGGFGGSAGSNDPKVVFSGLSAKYGTAYAQDIERLFRYETAHFKSNQYLETYSPGMVAVNDTFPFGWSSLGQFVEANPKYKNGYSVSRVFNTSAGTKKYVKFPSLEAAAEFVAWFIKTKRGGDVGKWNSTDASESAAYYAQLGRVGASFS